MAALHAISKGQLRMQLQDLAGQPVAVYPGLKALGIGLTGAAFLSQAIYWTERTRDAGGWFYKSQEDWEAETGLTRTEQEKARSVLRSLKILEEKRKGIPARLYFRVDEDRLLGSLRGDVDPLSAEDVIEQFGTRLNGLSKAGFMRAKRAGVQAEHVNYAEVLRSHGMVCGCCGEPITCGPGQSGDALVFDYKTPIAADGAHVASNLQPAHAKCNIAKADKVAYVRQASLSTQDELAGCAKTNLSVLPSHAITENTAEITPEITADTLPALPADAGSPAAKSLKRRKAAAVDEDLQAVCRATWTAYATAYHQRYGAMPIRNAKVNNQVKQLVSRLPQDEAPHVAAFYVGVNDAFLIRNCHDFGSLLAKAEGFRTQWATGRQTNGTTARQIEATQANVNAAQEAAARIMAKGGAANANPFLR